MELIRYALWVQYDGRFFRGFQRLKPRLVAGGRPGVNPRLWPRQQTVQEELEVKLSLILREEIKLMGAGRTDAGVHATCQVVAFDTHCQLAPKSLMGSLNAILAEGVCVRQWRAVALDFHPRFSARRRLYHYYLWPEAPQISPFWQYRCWMLPHELDLPLMREAAASLLGRHDFTAYTRKPEGNDARNRELQQLDIHEQVLKTRGELGPWAELASMICFEVRANAFLRRMVRQLVANLVQVGIGAWPPDRPAEILQSKDPTLSAPPAPAHGLFLVDVDYGE